MPSDMNVYKSKEKDISSYCIFYINSISRRKDINVEWKSFYKIHKIKINKSCYFKTTRSRVNLSKFCVCMCDVTFAKIYVVELNASKAQEVDVLCLCIEYFEVLACSR